MRSSTNFNGRFRHLGDILAVPELTTNSPFVTGQSGNVSDEINERIPQQIMSLLRLGDQPRFVIYAYGQSLKPADHSIVQSAGYVGMCTNYQITGETAIRAVVRIEGAPTNTHAVVESFNALPPD